MKKSGKVKAFTLTEMLATVLIMSLVVAASVTGIVSISTSYRKVLQASNAEELCNLINTSLNGELSYANYVDEHLSWKSGVDDAGNDVTEERLSFYSAKYRMCSYILEKDADEKEKLFIESKVFGKMPVLADDAYPNGLEISSLNITYDDTNAIFDVAVEIGDGNRVISNTTFKVKAMNAK